jgi:hypothetical protein
MVSTYVYVVLKLLINRIQIKVLNDEIPLCTHQNSKSTIPTTYLKLKYVKKKSNKYQVVHMGYFWQGEAWCKDVWKTSHIHR